MKRRIINSFIAIQYLSLALFIGLLTYKMTVLQLQKKEIDTQYKKQLNDKVDMLYKSLYTIKSYLLKYRADLIYVVITSISLTNDVTNITFPSNHKDYVETYFKNDVIDLNDTTILCQSPNFDRCSDKYSLHDDSNVALPEQTTRLINYFGSDVKFYSQYFTFWTDSNVSITDSSIYASVELFANFKNTAHRLFDIVITYIQNLPGQNMDLYLFGLIRYTDEDVNITSTTLQNVKYIYTIPSFSELPTAKIKSNLFTDKKSALVNLSDGCIFLGIMISDNSKFSS